MSRFVGHPRAVAEAARDHAEFPVLLPRRLPVGYSLSAILYVPGLGSALTLEFRSRRSVSWTLTQRQSQLSFDDELGLVTSPWRRCQRRGRQFAYAARSWQGEPVERHLTTSRQTVWWQQDGVMLELERVVGHSPRWWRLWRVIDSLEHLDSA